MSNIKENNAIEKYQFIHHFLPHPKHKSRAKLLSHKSLLTYIVVLAIVFTTMSIIPAQYPGVLGYASNINVSDLLRETNEVRAQHGLNPLVLNGQLSTAAQKKAEDMFADDYWAHIAPDGREPWDFILDSGYDYLYAGENLAKNFNSSSAVVDAWFKSPSHRENLLNSNYDDIGFAVVNGVLDGYETTLVVQMFGRPRIQVPITNSGDSEGLSQVRLINEESLPNVIPVGSPASLENNETPSYSVVPIMAFDTQNAAVLPAIDVAIAYRSISIAFVLFLIFLLTLDVWYSKRHSIPKINGHTLVHLTFLLITLMGVLIAMAPGRVL
ncbi:MAG: CAP domain-containing protein [Patescibacteria group bacterium]